MLLAAASQRTRTLRIGALVSVLPFHDPIEVAEQYAMIDQLSGGRLNLGLGSGYIALEFQGFGIDPATKRERFDRSLEVVLAAFRGDPVVSAASDPAGSIRVNVRPVQRPHPPLWIAVQRREALPFVARRGVNVALVPYATVQDVDELALQIQEFRQYLPAGATAQVSVALHLYAGPHLERARAALQRYLDSRLATQSAFYQDKVRRDPRHASAEIDRALRVRSVRGSGWRDGAARGLPFRRRGRGARHLRLRWPPEGRCGGLGHRARPAVPPDRTS